MHIYTEVHNKLQFKIQMLGKYREKQKNRRCRCDTSGWECVQQGLIKQTALEIRKVQLCGLLGWKRSILASFFHWKFKSRIILISAPGCAKHRQNKRNCMLWNGENGEPPKQLSDYGFRFKSFPNENYRLERGFEVLLTLLSIYYWWRTTKSILQSRSNFMVSSTATHAHSPREYRRKSAIFASIILF